MRSWKGYVVEYSFQLLAGYEMWKLFELIFFWTFYMQKNVDSSERNFI